MTHTVHEKQKLLNRVRRIKGQVEAIERALEQEERTDDGDLPVAIRLVPEVEMLKIIPSPWAPPRKVIP